METPGDDDTVAGAAEVSCIIRWGLLLLEEEVNDDNLCDDDNGVVGLVKA